MKYWVKIIIACVILIIICFLGNRFLSKIGLKQCFFTSDLTSENWLDKTNDKYCMCKKSKDNLIGKSKQEIIDLFGFNSINIDSTDQKMKINTGYGMAIDYYILELTLKKDTVIKSDIILN